MICESTGANILADNNNEDVTVKKVLGFIALLSFCITVYFASREWMALLIVVPLSLLCLSGIEKFGATAGFSGVIVVCIASVLWINSVTPLWGERYAVKQEYTQAIKDAKKEEYKEVERISMAQVAVKGLLKDPSSAKFSEEYITPVNTVCGTVNAKNSLGAYSGSDRYIYNGSAYIDDGGNGFSSLWKSLCK